MRCFTLVFALADSRDCSIRKSVNTDQMGQDVGAANKWLEFWGCHLHLRWSNSGPEWDQGYCHKGVSFQQLCRCFVFVLTQVLISKSSHFFRRWAIVQYEGAFLILVHTQISFSRPTHMFTACLQLSTNTFICWTPHTMCRIGERGLRPGRTTTFKPKAQTKERTRRRTLSSNLRWSRKRGRSGRREGQPGAKSEDVSYRKLPRRARLTQKQEGAFMPSD
jgi:hypothetical protein